MINKLVTLDYLETFRAVATSGSMHRAAEARHMTQPAVTRQMGILAREVGVPLFARFGRGVRLTAAGESLLRESEEIFQRIGEGLARVREADGASRHRIAAGASHYVAASGLAGPVREFRGRSPEVRIDLSIGSSEEMAVRVREGMLDLAVVTLPGRVEGLRQIRLWTDTFVAAVPIDHPVSGGTGVSLEELAAYPLILPPAVSATRVLIDRAFRRKQVRPGEVSEFETLEAIAAGVEMALGCAILPERLLTTVPGRYPMLVSCPLSEFGESREIGVLVRSGKSQSVHETALIELLRERLFDPRSDGVRRG
jgi:DNA-binding transcriptional LysR family regulator